MVLPQKWSEWFPLTKANLKTRSRQIPAKGVYLIRVRDGAINRVLGSSPLIYLGIPLKDGSGTISRRLAQAITPNAPHPAEPRLRELLKLGKSIDFCFAESDDPQEAERTLLTFYERVHLELPPFNRQGGNAR